MDEERLVYRSGLLQQPQQLEARAPDGQNQFLIRPEVMLSFLETLVRNTSNGDLLWLSAKATAEHAGATEQEIRVLLEACKKAREGHKTPFTIPIE